MAEQAVLDRWQRQSEWPLAGIALTFLVAYSIKVLGQPHGTTTHVIDALTIAAWAAFAVDYVVRLWLAPNRADWFLRHLLDLAIVALPLLQPLRLLRVIVLIGALQKAIGAAIHGRTMFYTVSTAIVVVYVASLAELQAERRDPQATITSFGKAVWWSITTITTVGYGNEYPITDRGRVIAALLMISGMTLVGMITATLASWMVRRVAEEGSTSQALTATHLDTLRSEIRALRDQLNQDPPDQGDRST